MKKNLSEEDEEDHQQGEQSNGLRQGKAQQGVSDQLLGNVGVASSTVDQGAEHDAQASTHTCNGNGSKRRGKDASCPLGICLK